MNLRAIRAPLLILATLIVTFPLARRADDVRYDPEPGVKLDLPATVGLWHGQQIRYCPSGTCQKAWMTSELAGSEKCPSCGATLDEMAFSERVLLPGDTTLRRYEYRTPEGQQLFVTLVLSGRERSSIHRPEACLSGAGSEIVGGETIEVPMAGRSPLPMRLLTTRRSEQGRTIYTFYAYWFVAKGRETASHADRLIAMASDRLFRGVTHRWAYLSVTGVMTPGSTAHLDTLRAFVRDLQPLVVAP